MIIVNKCFGGNNSLVVSFVAIWHCYPFLQKEKDRRMNIGINSNLPMSMSNMRTALTPGFIEAYGKESVVKKSREKPELKRQALPAPALTLIL